MRAELREKKQFWVNASAFVEAEDEEDAMRIVADNREILEVDDAGEVGA